MPKYQSNSYALPSYADHVDERNRDLSEIAHHTRRSRKWTSENRRGFTYFEHFL